MKKILMVAVFVMAGFSVYAQCDINYWKYSTTSRELTPEIREYWSANKFLQEKEMKKCWNSPKQQYFKVPIGSRQWNICAEIYAVNTPGINNISDANEKLIFMKNAHRKGLVAKE